SALSAVLPESPRYKRGARQLHLQLVPGQGGAAHEERPVLAKLPDGCEDVYQRRIFHAIAGWGHRQQQRQLLALRIAARVGAVSVECADHVADFIGLQPSVWAQSEVSQL